MPNVSKRAYAWNSMLRIRLSGLPSDGLNCVRTAFGTSLKVPPVPREVYNNGYLERQHSHASSVASGHQGTDAVRRFIEA